MDAPNGRPSATVQDLSFRVGVPSVPGGDPEPWAGEDGTVLPERPQRYGEEWTEIVFEANDLMQATPDYRFLYMVAGAANTSVQSMYRADDLRRAARQAGQAATAATRASDVARRLWEPYTRVAAILERFDESGTQQAFSDMSSAARYALAAAHQTRLILERQETVRPYLVLSNPDGTLPPGVGNNVPTPREFDDAAIAMADTLAWLSGPTAPDPPIEPPVFAVQIETLLDLTVAPQIVRLAKRAARPNADPGLLFFLTVMEVSWERVWHLPAVAGYLRPDPDVAGEVSVGPPPVAVGRPGTPRPPAGRAAPVQVWLGWASTVLAALENRQRGGLVTARSSPQFKLLHAVVTGYVSAARQETEAMVRREARNLRAAADIFARSVARGIDEADAVATWALDEGETVQKLAEAAERLQTALRDNVGVRGFLEEGGPGGAADVQNALLEAVNIVQRLREEEAELRKQIDEALEGGVALLVNVGPRPGWALQPRFTGRVDLSAPAVAAMNNAYADVAHWLPGLAPVGSDVELIHAGLKRTPILAQLYANLVAAHLLESSIRFPRQWRLEKAYPRAMGNRVSALLRMSSWTWGGGDAPYDTQRPRASARSGTVDLHSLLLSAPVMHHAAPPPPVALGAPGTTNVGTRFPPPAKRRRKDSLRNLSPRARRRRLAEIAAGWTERDIRRAVLAVATQNG